VLVSASVVVTRWWWIWGPVAGVAVFAARRWLRDPVHRRRWHAMRLRLPVSGELESKLAAARFARALGVLLRSGAPALTALRLARESVGNDSLGARLDDAVAAVGRGDRIAGSVEGVLPPLAVQLFAAGEESGSLEAMCERVAEIYDGEVQRSLRTLVRR
jgi:type II secretory pathway component PulF